MGARDLLLERVAEYHGGAKVDELEDALVVHAAVVELQVAVGEPHGVEVVDAGAYLLEAAVDLAAGHLSRHHDCEEVHGQVLHDLEVLVLLGVGEDVHCLHDVWVVQGRPDEELGGALLGVLLDGLRRLAGPELLYRKDGVVGGPDEDLDGAAGAGAERLAQLAVLLREDGVVVVDVDVRGERQHGVCTGGHRRLGVRGVLRVLRGEGLPGGNSGDSHGRRIDIRAPPPLCL